MGQFEEEKLAVTGEIFFFIIISKGKIFRADQKRSLYRCNYWRAGASTMSITLFW